MLAYLAALEQPFRQDATNEDRKYTRNRIRHELLPQLSREYSPAIVESLLRLAGLAADPDLTDHLSRQMFGDQSGPVERLSPALSKEIKRQYVLNDRLFNRAVSRCLVDLMGREVNTGQEFFKL